MMVLKKKVLLRNQPWKNKKRRRRERSRDDGSQPNHIPLDLTLDILSRLPAKSIMRCRCVSKLWSSFTKLPSFINSFTFRSSERLPRILVTFEFDFKQLVVSFPQNQNSDESYSPVYDYHVTGIYNYQHPQSESVQGLVLLCGLRIWNPSLRRVFTLPHPEEPVPNSLYNRKSYLGYDPLEGKHKVLCLFYWKNYVQPLILTLGAHESWRILVTKGRCPMHSPKGEVGRCFNGVLYYQARVDGQNIIMSFDFKSESFSTIKYPEQSHFHSPFGWSPTMIPYEGRLALVTDNLYYGNLSDVELYILKDENGHEWTHQPFPHVRCKSEWRKHMKFKGITGAGELIFAPTSFVDSFYFLYFDPRRNSIKEAFFEGFVGDEFRGRAGVNKRTECTSIFPNHMESIACL